MTDDDYRTLADRVAAGIAWLSENDSAGRFHVWFTAGLTPVSPMPAHESTPEVRTAFHDYYLQRSRWERMATRLEAEERRRFGSSPTFDGPAFFEFWRPGPARGHA